MEPRTAVLLKSLRWLQTSHEYSDLKIFCDNEVFQVHKAILCSRSKYFATACKWGKGDTLKEEIDLTEDDTMLVGLMLDYMYQLDYDDLLPDPNAAEKVDEISADLKPTQREPLAVYNNIITGVVEEPLGPSYAADDSQVVEDPAPNWGEWDIPRKKTKKPRKAKSKLVKLQLRDSGQDVNKERLVVNTLMYALADKYGIKDLKSLAKEKFAAAVVQDWESKAFVRAAELAFETTLSSDRGLRDLIVNTVNKHRELADYDEVQKLLDSGNGIAWAVLQAVLSHDNSYEGLPLPR